MRISFEQAVEKLKTNKEELFDAYESFIINDFNTNNDNILKDAITFKRITANNYLALKTNEMNSHETIIKNYEDIKVLDKEIENKVEFLRFSLLKNGDIYFFNDTEVKYEFKPYMILAKKNNVKNKKVEKIIDSFLNEEKEYASRYLNADVSAEKTYEDSNIEIIIVDKRG